MLPGRPGGRSVPFGVHLPVLRRGGLPLEELWVPFVEHALLDFVEVDVFELSERVSDDFFELEQLELNFEKRWFSWDGYLEVSQ